MNEAFRLAVSGPHHGQPVFFSGEDLHSAKAALIMAHGRGAGAADMLALAEKLARPGFVFLAPQAASNHWYPKRFSEPIDSNQPWLDSALEVMNEASVAAHSAGIPPERQIVMGFSQGACLALEFAARSGLPFAGAAGLAGSLIGPLDTVRDYPPILPGLNVFLGCSDEDPFIPKEYVLASANIFKDLGAQVTTRLYPNLDHRINLDEIRAVMEMMEKIVC